MEVAGLRVDATGGDAILLLRESASPRRVLPVVIGPLEAFSIAAGLGAASPPRPLAHDLMVEVMAATGARLVRVDVTELREGTFFAELDLAAPSGQVRLSSRPSDAIALAVRVAAPVFASEDVLDAAGLLVAEDLDEAGVQASIDEAVARFRSFLDDVEPTDFGDPGEAGGDPGSEAPPAGP
jgi:uncharacterized protein